MHNRMACWADCGQIVQLIVRFIGDVVDVHPLQYAVTTTGAGVVISRENLFDFDKFAYGSAQSTLLFLIIAVMTALYIWIGKVRFDGGDR